MPLCVLNFVFKTGREDGVCLQKSNSRHCGKLGLCRKKQGLGTAVWKPLKVWWLQPCHALSQEDSQSQPAVSSQPVAQRLKSIHESIIFICLCFYVQHVWTGSNWGLQEKWMGQASVTTVQFQFCTTINPVFDRTTLTTTLMTVFIFRCF